MNTTLPPAEAAKLDALKHPADAQFQPPGQAPGPTATPAPAQAAASIAVEPTKPGGFIYWLMWPVNKLLRFTALSALSAGFILLAIAFAATVGYINGSETEKVSGIAAKDELLKKFAVDLPLDIKFKQGTVESYGFFRNWLWRQAKAKEFALSATVSTNKDANTTLKGTTITQTLESGDKFQLKPGTNDVWQLVPPPEIPAPTAVK